MIISPDEYKFAISEEAQKLRKEYMERHPGEVAPGYNRDEFASIEEWVTKLKEWSASISGAIPVYQFYKQRQWLLCLNNGL